MDEAKWTRGTVQISPYARASEAACAATEGHFHPASNPFGHQPVTPYRMHSSTCCCRLSLLPATLMHSHTYSGARKTRNNNTRNDTLAFTCRQGYPQQRRGTCTMSARMGNSIGGCTGISVHGTTSIGR